MFSQKLLRNAVTGIFLFGLMLCSQNTAHAQEPSLNLQINAQYYPTIMLTVACDRLEIGARGEPHFSVAENLNAEFQTTYEPSVQILDRPALQIALLLDVTRRKADIVQQTALALQQFNDNCRWTSQDRLAVFIPTLDGQQILVQPEIDWNNDPGEVVAQLQNLAQQMQVAADPPGANFQALIAQMVKCDYTPLHDLINKALLFLQKNSEPETKTKLVVVSDGVDKNCAPAQTTTQSVTIDPQAILDLSNKDNTRIQLYTVLLTDASEKNPTFLRQLVDAEHHPEHYYTLGKNEPTTFNQLWQQLTLPVQYQLTYNTQRKPPFEISVTALVSPTQQTATATKLLLRDLEPAQVKIIEPAQGAIFTVATKSTTETAILTQPVTAKIALQWPATRPIPPKITIFYKLDANPQITNTVPISAIEQNSIVITGTLGALAAGVHHLSVALDEGIPGLANNAETSFEVREKNLVLEQSFSDWQQRFNRWGVIAQWTFVLGLLSVLGISLVLWLTSWFRNQAHYRKVQIDIESLRGTITKPEPAYGLRKVSEWSIEKPQIKAALFLIQGDGIAGFLPLLVDDKQQRSTTTLGSAEDNTYSLNERYIDSYQCFISYENGLFTLYDGPTGQLRRRSLNGTYVNSRPLENPDGWPLKSGDIIQFGPLPFVKYSFRKIQPEDEAPPASLPTPTPAPFVDSQRMGVEWADSEATAKQ